MRLLEKILGGIFLIGGTLGFLVVITMLTSSEPFSSSGSFLGFLIAVGSSSSMAYFGRKLFLLQDDEKKKPTGWEEPSPDYGPEFDVEVEYGSERTVSNSGSSRNAISEAAHRLADTINTKSKFNTAVHEIEEWENDLHNEDRPKQRAKLSRAIEIGEAAIEIARRRGYEWHFTPTLNLDLPTELADIAYTVIKDREKKDRLIRRFPSYRHCFYSLDPQWEDESDVEERPEHLQAYRNLVKRLRETTDVKAQAEMLDAFLKKYPDAYDFSIPTGHEFMIESLRSAGVPRPEIMMQKGFTTVEECKHIDIKELTSWYGIGPKTVAEFKQFLARAHHSK